MVVWMNALALEKTSSGWEPDEPGEENQTGWIGKEYGWILCELERGIYL